jgi:predicted AlkP superfamily pyrophosphatase or phosphodiesterase
VHLVDIAPSIFASLGLPDTEDRIGIGESPAGLECLFLIDGLGVDVIKDYSQYLPTISGLTYFSPVETAFPSTTVTSLTTLMTGELPGVHGMLGYTVRVPRSGGRIFNALKWDERVDPHIWQPVPTFFQRASLHGITVSHVAAKRYENTGFTQAAFRGALYRGANNLAELVAQTKASLRISPAFTYVYVNDLDVAGHNDGVASSKWLMALKIIDHVVATLIAQLPRGTRFWLSSDHGMVNVEDRVILGLNNALLDGISVIAGEPRARHLYFDEGQLAGIDPNQIAERWRDFFGERADVFTHEEAVNANLFGPTISENAHDRMGDLVVIARKGLVMIDPSREALESAMVGHHGALTVVENFVPLGVLEIN